ncbi:MAG: ABC-F family ATP-binding cassette domain-containing protein [Candidatus Gracilibacteria bacterium]|nr:ABC-F family ATP-binding cassette domain-containing protein [Candidatus Gracilibacteria bacterium]
MKHISLHIPRFEIDGVQILDKISLLFNANDRIAVVGPNGAGKTTLMKVITGEIEVPDATFENTGSLSLGYLSQIHFDTEDILVKEELRLAFSDILQLEVDLEVAEANMESPGGIEHYTEVLERYHMLGGYDYEREIDRVARGLGIFELLGRSVREVSGGQRTKIALAKVLLSRPEFLFLDEPTNFIDLASVEWLETYLNETWKGGYMIISHDREFLDQTTTLVFEVVAGKMTVYHGNYTAYMKERNKNFEKSEKLFEEQQEFIKSEKTLINRFRAGSRAGFAKSREKALEKVEILEKPEANFRPTFLWNFGENASERVLFIKEAFIGRTDPLFYINELTLYGKNRIGIVGENGVGKSTLLKTILGKIPLLDGRIIQGKGVEAVYYSQMHEELDFGVSLYANYERLVGTITRERLAGLLGYYGFTFHDIDKPMFAFSGGQVSKILFAIIGQKSANLLILDEPTNHLDYDSREALEYSLRGYKGTILFISHDRYFVNRLATHLWIIDNGEVSLSYGNYNDYKLKVERGIDFDMSLWNDDGELSMVLEEKLGKNEAKRIKAKFARTW